jgi:transcriptional regulator with XRE-family HTH domain
MVATQTENRLGPKFRTLRKERGLSLSDVAQATQISSSFLSLFEKGKSDITFGRLARLVKFFGISITDLIPDPEPSEQVVVRREARRHIESPLEAAELYLLTHDTRHTMMPVIGIIEPGAAPCETTITEGGELFVMILAGEIEISSETEPTVRLQEGDAAYYHTDRSRLFSNVGEGRAEVFCVQTPPTL